jgi:hypothetical protein
MAADPTTALAEASRAFVVAAAGCGKTEEIARAVALGSGRPQLVLTHTHAGVRALRDRLAGLKVPSRQYNVETIAGWALKYAASYPKLAEIVLTNPTGDDWPAVYEAAVRVLRSSAVQQVVTETYGGVYVDEYQDCAKRQHRLVMALAALRPCRILGDPLQGIFDFEGDPVSWTDDIEPHFERLPDLTTPWRWVGKNPALGDRLQKIREALINRDAVDLRGDPIVWRPVSDAAQWDECMKATKKAGSVVAIHKWAASAHQFAAKLKGVFTSMEEIDCADLLKWAGKIEEAAGSKRALRVIEFASRCMTVVSSELKPITERLKDGELEKLKKQKKHRDIAEALFRVAGDATLLPVPDALREIAKTPGRVLYRRELWRELGRALDLHLRNPEGTLREAAWRSRNRTRHAGRAIERRTVSRTLLVKGLEFDHAIVLNAGDHNAKNLYVALTRGARSLTVLSREPIVAPSSD